MNEENRYKRTTAIPLWKKTLFSLIPLAVLLFSAELYFRIYPAYKPIVGKTRTGYVIPDKTLIWKLNPNLTGYRAPNTEGFRDNPYNPDAEFKILLLGDSISWGDCVPHTEKIYPQVCEITLSKETGKSFEIINTAVPGYSTLQELRALKLYSRKYKPQMVILQFCLNDVVDRFRTIAAYGGDSVFLGVDTRAACRGFAKLAEYSRLVETIVRYKQRQGRNWEEYQVKNIVKTPLSKEIKYAWKLVFKELLEMKKVSDKSGTDFLILVTPFKFQLNADDSQLLPQKMLRAFAEQNDIDFIDLLPAFRKNKDKKLFADADHFSVEGHKVAAAVLEEYLKEKFAQKLK